MSGSQGRDSDRRCQILGAAARLLDHYGPQKTTVSDIAREAGVGVGTVYLEFASKEEIIEALSSSRHAKVLDAMRRAAEAAGPDHAARLRAALDARAEAFLRLARGGAHAPDLVHCGNPPIREAHERYRSEERALLVRLIEAGCAAGEFEVPDPVLAASALQRAYSSFCPPSLYFMPSADLRSALDTLHALVLYGLVRRPSR